MKTVIYQGLSDCAKAIRQKVFMEEQGFRNEFDAIDETAAHIVMFDEDQIPAATCRVFWDPAMHTYVLGRLAVVREYRGKKLGAAMVREAESYIRQNGGKSVVLHAQCRITAFYQHLGFAAFGDADEEEGCPHIWMRKDL